MSFVVFAFLAATAISIGLFGTRGRNRSLPLRLLRGVLLLAALAMFAAVVWVLALIVQLGPGNY